MYYALKIRVKCHRAASRNEQLWPESKNAPTQFVQNSPCIYPLVHISRGFIIKHLLNSKHEKTQAHEPIFSDGAHSFSFRESGGLGSSLISSSLHGYHPVEQSQRDNWEMREWSPLTFRFGTTNPCKTNLKQNIIDKHWGHWALPKHCYNL